MSFFRQRLGAWALGWLLCQTAAVAAFLPSACCTAHDAHSTEAPCHESAPAAADDCRLRSSCEGPAVALSALISIPGILPVTTAETLTATEPVALVATLPVPLSSALHDTPPPKA